MCSTIQAKFIPKKLAMNESSRKIVATSRQPVGRLVELHLDRVRERLARRVDPFDRVLELVADALEVA